MSILKKLSEDRLQKNGLVALFLLFILALLFADPFFSTDSSAHNFVSKKWFVGYLKEFYFPLWNSSLLGGFYHTASSVSGVFTPEIVFHFLFSNYWAQHLSHVLLLGLSALGSFKLLKPRGFSRGLRVIFAISYVLSGYTLSMTINYVFMAGICLLPLAASFYEKYSSSKKNKDGLIFTLFSSWILLEGDIYSFLTLVIFIGFSLFERKASKEEIKSSLLAISLSLMIAMINYIPALDVLSYTNRAGGLDDFIQASYFSLHPQSLIQLVSPAHFGFYGDGTFKGLELIEKGFPFPKRFWIDSIYLGIIPLLLFVGGLFSLQNFKKRWVSYLIVLLSLLVCIGNHGFLHKMFFNLPLYSSLRFPAKFFTITNFFFLLVVIYNLKGSIEFIKKKNIINEKNISKLIVLTSVLIFIDLYFRSPPTLKLGWKEIDQVEKQPAVSKMLEKTKATDRKILWDLNLLTHSKAIDNFRPNWGIFHGAEYVFGYEPTISSGLENINGNNVFKDFKFWRDVLGINFILTPALPQEPHLKEIAKEGLIKALAIDEKKNIALLEVNPKRSTFELYENAQSVSDFNIEEMKKYSEKKILFIQDLKENKISENGIRENLLPSIDLPNEKEIILKKNQLNQDKYLLFRQQFHRGWKAYVDGVETKVYKANYLHMAIYLSSIPGSQNDIKVKFKFSPPSFYFGGFLSLFGLALSFIYFLKRKD